MFIGFGYSPSRAERNVGVAFDADAQAFFTAASITDSSQKNAVNQLVLDLKSYNIWTKMKALYPIVGGSASSHAVNLKTPGTYNLTFATGVTHSSTGMVSNGTSGYGDTNFIPSVNGTLNSSHISFYCRTNVNETRVDFGAANQLSTQGGTVLYIRSTDICSSVVDRYASIASDYVQYSNTDSRGFYINSRTASNLTKGYKNGIFKDDSTLTGNRTSLKLTLLALNKDNPNAIVQYSTKQCAFASIGDGLDDTESANFYTAVQTYQTTLARQV